MGLFTFFKNAFQTPKIGSGRIFSGRGSSLSSNQGPRQVSSILRGYFDALTDSKDRTPIPASALSLKYALQSLSRERLAYLGNYIYDNDGLAGYAVDQIANYSVPIVPQAASNNPEWNRQADKLVHPRSLSLESWRL